MDIRDLSIGDWVQAQFPNGDKWNERILYLSNTGRLEVQYKDGKTVRCTIDFIQPIPITPKILEKNELEYIDDGNDAVIFLCCDMFWARLCVGDTFWQVGIHSEDRLDAVVCNIQHIHELQHALRLAGLNEDIRL